MKNDLVNILKENTIYTPGQLKKFVRNKQNVADNFWINFLGIAGLYNADPNNSKLMAYLKGQRVQLSAIDDNSQDWSLVVYMAVEGNFISTTQANELTKFMALMKQGKIDKIDENLLRASLSPILPKLPPYSTIKSPISNWLKGKITLSDLMKPFFRFAKHEDFCPEFAEFAKIIIPKIDDNLPGGKSGKVSSTGKGMKGLAPAPGAASPTAKVPVATPKKAAKIPPAPVVKTPLDIMIDNLSVIKNSSDLWLLWMKIWPMKKSQRKKELNNHALQSMYGTLADSLDSYFASQMNTILYGAFAFGNADVFKDITATDANLYFSKAQNLTKDHIINHYDGWLDKKQNRVGRAILGKYLADNFDPMDKQHIEWMAEPGWTNWARKAKDTIAQFDTGNQGVSISGYKVPGGEIQRKILAIYMAGTAPFLKFLDVFYSVAKSNKSTEYSLRSDGCSNAKWQTRYLIKYIAMSGGSAVDDKKLVAIQDWFLKKFGKDSYDTRTMYDKIFCHFDATQQELVKKGILGTTGYTTNVKASAFAGMTEKDGSPIMNDAIFKDWIAIARSASSKLSGTNYASWSFKNLRDPSHLGGGQFEKTVGFKEIEAANGIGQFFEKYPAKINDFFKVVFNDIGSDKNYPNIFLHPLLLTLGYKWENDKFFTLKMHNYLRAESVWEMPSWKFGTSNVVECGKIDALITAMKAVSEYKTMFSEHVQKNITTYLKNTDNPLINYFLSKFVNTDSLFTELINAWKTNNPVAMATLAENCFFRNEAWKKVFANHIKMNQKDIWIAMKTKYLGPIGDKEAEYKYFYGLAEALKRHVTDGKLWITDQTIVDDILRIAKNSIAIFKETGNQPNGSTWSNLNQSKTIPRSFDEWFSMIAGNALQEPESLVKGFLEIAHNPDNYANKFEFVTEVKLGVGRSDRDSNSMWCNSKMAEAVNILDRELDVKVKEIKGMGPNAFDQLKIQNSGGGKNQFQYIADWADNLNMVINRLGEGQEDLRKKLKSNLVFVVNSYYKGIGVTNRKFLDITNSPEDFDVEIKAQFLKKEAQENAHRYSKNYGMRGANKELKDKITGGIGTMMFDIFHSPHKKELNGIIDSYGDRSEYVAKLLRDNIMMGPLIEEIMGSNTPIKPEVPLKPADIVKVLKFNNFSYKTTGKGRSKKKGEGHVEYLDRIKKLPTLEDTVHDLKVKKITSTKEDCEKRTAEFFKYYTPEFKHGDVAVEVLDSFTVHFDNKEFKEFKALFPQTEMVPCFHGTGTVAASMILRFGFKVSSESTMRSAGVAVAGRALGDGTYVAPWIDKACGYVRDGSNWSNRKGNIGYILEIDCILGQERVHHRSAGFSGATAFQSFKSAEYCVYDAKAQIHVMRAHRVRLTNRKFVEAMHQKHFPKGITEENTMFPNFFEHYSKKYVGFKQYMKEVVEPEEPVDDAPIHAMKFIHFSDTIAVSKTMGVTPEEFAETYANNNILIQDCQEGWNVILYHKEIPEMTVVVPETEEFIQDDPEGLGSLYLFWLDKLKTKKETT